MVFDAWYEFAYQHMPLTIADIQALKPGQSLKVLAMDRNLGDICLEVNKPDEVKIPVEFFRFNSATFTHQQDMQGTIVYHWQGGDSESMDFEFDVEYKKDHFFFSVEEWKIASRKFIC